MFTEELYKPKLEGEGALCLILSIEIRQVTFPLFF